MNDQNHEHLQETSEAILRSSLYAFTWKVFETLHNGVNDRFIPNWHIEAICHELEEMHRGHNLRLVITMPPRHLKSITTSVAYVAFLLGHDPSLSILVASYGKDLGSKHSEDFRRILESGWYKKLFPGTRIDRGGNRQDQIITTKGGGRKAVSIGGAVTGFGADYIIVDDLLKAASANSETELQSAQLFIESSLLSRFNQPGQGRLVAIQQRLHEMDPAGYLLGKGGYHHLNLTAIAEEDEDIPIGSNQVYQRKKGDALFPQRMSLETLDALRRELGSSNFNCQYQQNPMAPGGSVLKWEKFGTYDEVEDRSWYQKIVQSWDTGMSADPRSDYSVCTIWGYREGIWYLLNVFRDRLDYPDLLRKIDELFCHWRPDVVYIEKAATGIPLLRELRQRDRSRFIAATPSESKLVRFNAACAPVDNGLVYLPSEATWLEDFRRELQSFPRSRYDDQVDSFSQFINQLQGPCFTDILNMARGGRPQGMPRKRRTGYPDQIQRPRLQGNLDREGGERPRGMPRRRKTGYSPRRDKPLI
jgi:predicted phage terminase large subunit-like protein